MAHKVPRLADGEKVITVTQALNVMHSGGLEGWNYMQGWAFGYEQAVEDMAECPQVRTLRTPPPDWKRRYEKRDAAGDAGTYAHSLIEAHLKNLPKPDPPEVLEEAGVEKAEGCFSAYIQWERAHDFRVVESELTLVSEQYRYGGTLDIGAVVGDLGIVDIKTSKGVYLSMEAQVAAYGQLWNENREDKVHGYHILRLGQDGGFSHHYYPDLTEEFELFLLALGMAKLVKQNGWKL